MHQLDEPFISEVVVAALKAVSKIEHVDSPRNTAVVASKSCLGQNWYERLFIMP